MAKDELPRSPLAPEKFPHMPNIAGLSLYTAHAGYKYKNRNDTLFACFAEGTTAAGVFTTSSAAAAPVHWSRGALAQQTQARALVVTAGNANAFTGKSGDETVRRIASASADKLGCDVQDILIAQTGVIGQPFPVERFESILPNIDDGPGVSWEAAAHAIMTTDTFPKAAMRTVDIDGALVSIAGIAKGSGMIEPNMATMLAFVMTDAKISAEVLQTLTVQANETSFNAITVDGDTSTNDCLLVFATGQAPHGAITDPRLASFRRALSEVCEDLALQIVRDGEGASKLVEITVTGAKDDASAKRIAKAVANSPLVKTAIAGGDANWGRLVMAVGKSGEPVQIDKLSIRFGPHVVAQAGAVSPEYLEETGTTYFRNRELELSLDVGVGHGRATVWTCDLTHGYIDINADYRS